jgi:hypothetical protein
MIRAEVAHQTPTCPPKRNARSWKARRLRDVTAMRDASNPGVRHSRTGGARVA